MDESTGPERSSIRSKSKVQPSASGDGACFVYILECSDASYYVGCTADLVQREIAHNMGTAAKYTAARRPVRIIYTEPQTDWSAARKRETQLKHWTHAKKEALVNRDMARLRALARRRGR